jgi:hypothetical protein
MVGDCCQGATAVKCQGIRLLYHIIGLFGLTLFLGAQPAHSSVYAGTASMIEIPILGSECTTGGSDLTTNSIGCSCYHDSGGNCWRGPCVDPNRGDWCYIRKHYTPYLAGDCNEFCYESPTQCDPCWCNWSPG